MHFIKKNWLVLSLICVIVIGGFLRFYNLGIKSLDADESLMWHYAVNVSKGQMSDVVNSYNIYILLQSKIIGISQTEFSLRFLSAFSSFLTIPALFFLLRRFINPLGSLIGAGLFSASPLIIVIAQRVREYGLFLLFVVLLIYFFEGYRRNKDYLQLIGFWIFSFLAIFTHISTIWVLLSLGIIYLYGLKDKKRRDASQFFALLAFAICVLVTGVLFWHYGFSQWATYGDKGYLEYGYWWSGSLPSLYHLVIENSWFVFAGLANERSELLIAISIAAAIYYGLIMGKTDRIFFMLALLPVAITIVAGLARIYPFIGSHPNNIYMAVGVFGLAGLGFSEIQKRAPFFFGLALLFVAVVLIQDSWANINGPSHQEMKPVVERLCTETVSGDQILVSDTATFAFNYYWPMCESPVRVNHQVDLVVFPFDDPSRISSQVQISNRGHVWLVLSFLKEQEKSRLLKQLEGATGTQFDLILDANGSWLYRLGN